MPHRALIDHRPWLLASILASATYFWFHGNDLPALFAILWKGAAVGLLAIYAARQARNADGWLLTAVMALGSLADMVLELSLVAGGALFALAHLVAITLFLRNRRPAPAGTQRLAALSLVIAAPLAAYLIAGSQPQWPLAVGYAGIVGAMAASAWISRFSRYDVGIGAVLFVVSDLAIFAHESGLVPGAVTAWLIWPLYYAGQLLITLGVTKVLGRGS